MPCVFVVSVLAVGGWCPFSHELRLFFAVTQADKTWLRVVAVSGSAFVPFNFILKVRGDATAKTAATIIRPPALTVG